MDTYDPSDEFIDEPDEQDELADFGAGVDDTPEMNEDGEIISESSDEEVRDFAMQDDRTIESDDGGTTETRKTTLDQEGLDGENIHAGSGGEDSGETDGGAETEPFDPDPDYKKGGIGSGRQATLEAIERRGRLDEVTEEDIDSIDDVTEAVRQIHLDGYMSPPDEVIETIENVYNGLRDDAKPEYRTDETLLRRINSARRYFDETYLPRLKRVKQMPSPVEAGRANYPADKAKKRSEKHRDARDELKKKLGTETGESGGIKAAASGARQRALEAVGSSVAEENERRREETREEGRDAVETGDLIQGGQPTPNVFEVIRVNKNSVTGRRPNPRAGQEKSLGDGVEGEWIEGRTDFDGMTYHHITEDDLDNLGELLPRADNISQDGYDSFDELRRDVGLPIERESEYVEDEERECTQKLAEEAGIQEHRAATVVDHFGDYEATMKGIQDVGKSGLKELDGIGDATADKVDNVTVDDGADIYDPTEEFTDDEITEKTETALSWADDPPNQYGNWTRYNSDLMHDDVLAAYVGKTDGIYSVAMVYEYETESPRDDTKLGGGIYTAANFDGMATPPREVSPRERISPTDSPLRNKSRRTRMFDALRLALEENPSEDVSTGEVADRAGQGYEPDAGRDRDTDNLTDAGLGDFGAGVEETGESDDGGEYESLEDLRTPNGWLIGRSPDDIDAQLVTERVFDGENETVQVGGGDMWAAEWTCKPEDTVKDRVVATEKPDGTHEVYVTGADGTHEKFAENIPDRETAVEVSTAFMEENECRSTADAYGYLRADHLDDVDTGSGALLQSHDVLDWQEVEAEKVKRNTDAELRAMERDAETETAPYDPTVEFDDLFGGDVPDEETQRDVMREVEEEKSDVPYHPDDREDTEPDEEREAILDEESDDHIDDTPEERVTVPLTDDGMNLVDKALAHTRNDWGEIREYMAWEDYEYDELDEIQKEKIPRDEGNRPTDGSMRLTEDEYDIVWKAVARFGDETGTNQTHTDVKDTLVRKKKQAEQPDPVAMLGDVDVQDEIGEFEKDTHNNAEIRYIRQSDDEKATVSAEMRQTSGEFKVSSARFDTSGDDRELITTNTVLREDFQGDSLEHESVAHRAGAEAETECDRLELERRAPEGWTVGKFDPQKPMVRFDDGCFTVGTHTDDADEKEYCRFVRATSSNRNEVAMGARDPKTGEVYTENSTGRQPADGELIDAAVETMQRMQVGDVLDAVEIEFGSIDAARSFRDEYGEYLHPDDNYRTKTVTVTEDLPEEAEKEARAEAVQTRAETGGTHGQAELTEDEKAEIDFSNVSIFHARTAKAIAADKGVGKFWLEFYDPTLTTDEHIEVYERASKDTAQGRDAQELSEDDIEEKAAEMAAKAEDAECKNAKDGCSDGYEEACEFLVEECGYEQDIVEELLDEDDFEVEGETVEVPDIDDAEVVRDELPTPVLVAFKKAWDGYRAGRANIDEGVEDAREYAGIINSIRQGIGQDPMEFEPKGGFEGGEVTPDDVEGVDEFETDEVEATYAGKVTVYDPTEAF